MAHRLIPTCRIFVAVFVTVLGSAGTTAIHAQALPDPTRPAGNAEIPGMPGMDNSGLQSIIRPSSGKPRALINGEIVALGAKSGDSRLVAVNADHVVLLNTDGSRETLYLTPGARKQSSKPVRPSNSKSVPREP